MWLGAGVLLLALLRLQRPEGTWIAARGRVFDEAWVREDLALMKSLGVNAIRTSHYPPHPRVLDLADEIGLWVVLEGDIETHGFEGADRAWADNPSDDPRWADAFDERTRRAFERDKNHPSIALWSLGNESGTGANLAAASLTLAPEHLADLTAISTPRTGPWPYGPDGVAQRSRGVGEG